MYADHLNQNLSSIINLTYHLFLQYFNRYSEGIYLVFVQSTAYSLGVFQISNFDFNLEVI